MTIYRVVDSFVSLENQMFALFAVLLSTLNGFFDSILFFRHPQVLKCMGIRKPKDSQSEPILEERIKLAFSTQQSEFNPENCFINQD